MILKLLLSILVLFIIPELLGLLICRFIKKEKNDIIFAFVVGYLMEFAICQILAVPMILYEVSFKILLNSYIVIISILSVLSFFINIIRIKDITNNFIKSLKETPKFLALITLILIGIQVYGFIGYAHIDDDDAIYVGTATTILQTDTLYKYSANTGAENGEQLHLRYRLGPFPVYTAIISKMIRIHPAIVAHLVFPCIFVPIVYMIYGLIGNELFKKDKKQTLLFLIILNFLFIWGNYSARTNFTFLLFRIWQGKAVLANIIIPVIWLLLLKAEDNDFKFINFLLLFIANLAGDFTTTMGIALVPITVMVVAFVLEIYKFNFRNGILKTIKNLSLCLASCIPSIVYGITYFVKG